MKMNCFYEIIRQNLTEFKGLDFARLKSSFRIVKCLNNFLAWHELILIVGGKWSNN